ncbi:hypothetical protein PG993_003963 [Apiospora rasikravindrae]|uniref:Uncharacterized protein n=1 Tax=Apiospora rasikravindrae TaxID=990691 RepID=A0ABR1U3Q0_9PEZI
MANHFGETYDTSYLLMADMMDTVADDLTGLTTSSDEEQHDEPEVHQGMDLVMEDYSTMFSDIDFQQLKAEMVHDSQQLSCYVPEQYPLMDPTTTNPEEAEPAMYFSQQHPPAAEYTGAICAISSSTPTLRTKMPCSGLMIHELLDKVDAMPITAPEREIMIAEAEFMEGRVKELGVSNARLQKRYLESGIGLGLPTGAAAEEWMDPAASYSPDAFFPMPVQDLTQDATTDRRDSYVAYP